MAAFENLRVNPFSSDRSKTVAFVSCKINTEIGALYLNNMTLVLGSKGLFLSFPSRKLPKPDAKGNEYQNHFFMDRNLKEPLQQAAIDEYNAKVGSGGGSFSGGGQAGGYGGDQGGGQNSGGGGYAGGQNSGGGGYAGGQNPGGGGYAGGQNSGGGSNDGAGNTMETPYGNPPAKNDDDIPF